MHAALGLLDWAPLQEGSLEKIVKALDGPTLVRKGTVDTICDGHTTLVCNEPGSNRRAGGQVPFLWALLGTNCKASMIGTESWSMVGPKWRNRQVAPCQKIACPPASNGPL